MKKILIGLQSFTIIFLLSLSIYSNTEKDLFLMDALDFYSPDSTKSRLDVYMEFPFDRLEFKRSKEHNGYFSSNIDLTIEIKDIEGREVINELNKEEILTPKTETEYLSENSKIILKNYFLTPGHYKLKVIAIELNTKKSSIVEREITMRDFLTEPVSISDVMILSKYTIESNNQKKITPDVSRNIADIDSFYVFFCVYKNSDDSRIDLNCNILDSKKNVIFHTTDFLDVTKGIEFQNQVFLKIPLANIPFDNYSIEIFAVTSQFTEKLTSSFVSFSNYLPMSLTNIDLLISQLQYIANNDEMENMKNGKTDDEKRKRFLEFWKSKDPTPNTKKNEVMQEYYRRLNYADKHFSSSLNEGWKSDMGMVYVIFGMPSNIDRHPYEMDTKPYEIWDYYDINREFIFIDDTGFGDYRLITPIYDEKFKIFK